MKRSALVSVFCALFLTNILAGATAGDISRLDDKCTHHNQNACVKLWAAVRDLTDAALLAKIVVELKDSSARLLAVRKLTDQAVLAKIATEDEDNFIRGIAIAKLTDQAVLAKIAVEDKAPEHRWTAAKMLTDQTLLAKIAVEDKEPGVRSAAAGALTDQALLARFATQRADLDVCQAAIEKLTDQALLTRLAQKEEDRSVRAAAIAAMDGSSPAVRSWAGDLGTLTFDLIESTARVSLAIREPRVRDRFPRIVFTARTNPNVQLYRSVLAGVGAIPGHEGGMTPGESVCFALCEDGKSIAKRIWKTDFPQHTDTFAFVPARVTGAELLGELLRFNRFTQEDLIALSASDVPEFREAVVWKLTDQALLTKIAAEDRVAEVRRAAEERLARIRNKTK